MCVCVYASALIVGLALKMNNDVMNIDLFVTEKEEIITHII